MNDDRLLIDLQDRYRGLLGELKACDDRADQLRVDLTHVEATIKIYKKDWSGTGLAPRRPSYRTRYMKVGKGTQTALQVLRDAKEPMTLREIVFQVLDRLGTEVTAASVRSTESTLRYTLKKNVAVQSEGRYPIRLSIKPLGSD